MLLLFLRLGPEDKGPATHLHRVRRDVSLFARPAFGHTPTVVSRPAHSPTSVSSIATAPRARFGRSSITTRPFPPAPFVCHRLTPKWVIPLRQDLIHPVVLQRFRD